MGGVQQSVVCVPCLSAEYMLLVRQSFGHCVFLWLYNHQVIILKIKGFKNIILKKKNQNTFSLLCDIDVCVCASVCVCVLEVDIEIDIHIYTTIIMIAAAIY